MELSGNAMNNQQQANHFGEYHQGSCSSVVAGAARDVILRLVSDYPCCVRVNGVIAQLDRWEYQSFNLEPSSSAVVVAESAAGHVRIIEHLVMPEYGEAVFVIRMAKQEEIKQMESALRAIEKPKESTDIECMAVNQR